MKPLTPHDRSLLSPLPRLVWCRHWVVRFLLMGSFLVVSFSSAACTSTTSQLGPVSGNAPASMVTTPQSLSLGQMLPISAIATISGKPIELEVARTPQEQATGLMHRPSLPDNRGMLFPFNPPLTVSFWMKNVQIPLDMIFLRQGKVMFIAADVPPCRSEPCPVYGPNVPIDQVIELRGGRAKELGIQVGDTIVIQYQPSSPSQSAK